MLKKNNINQLDPNASPDSAKKMNGGRRVNDLPIYIVAAVVIAFILMMVIVGIGRAKKKNTKPLLLKILKAPCLMPMAL